MVHHVLISRFSLVFTHNLYENQWLYYCEKLEQVNKTIIFLGLIRGFVSTFFYETWTFSCNICEVPRDFTKAFFPCYSLLRKLISFSNVCMWDLRRYNIRCTWCVTFWYILSFYFLSNFRQNLAFQIIQSSLLIFLIWGSLAVKFILSFVTSEFSDVGVLNVILIGSSRLSNIIFW